MVSSLIVLWGHPSKTLTGKGLDLEEGHGQLLGAFGEEGLDNAGAQAVVPHQAPPRVLGQVEVLKYTLQASNPQN